MKTILLSAGFALFFSTALGWYLWSPGDNVNATSAATLSDVQSQKLDKLTLLLEQQQVLQKKLSGQFSSVVQELAELRAATAGISSINSDLQSLSSEVGALKVNLGEYELQLALMNSSLEKKSDTSFHSTSDTGVVQQEERPQQQLESQSQASIYEVSQIKFHSEPQDQAWAMNVETEISSKFDGVDEKVILSDVSCKSASCKVSWSYQGIENLSPEELLNVEHKLYSALGKLGLVNAVFDQIASINGRNIAIFTKGDAEPPSLMEKR